MRTRNITLSLPEELVRDAKVIAAQKHTSVSSLLTSLLTDLVEEESRRKRARASFDREAAGLSLGTGGESPARRDELHVR